MLAMILALLGRESDISTAELESIYGANSIVASNNIFALLDTDSVDIDMLGGTIKTAELVDELPVNSDWAKTAKYITKNALPGQVFGTEDTSKKRLGVSVYGKHVPKRNITGLALELKKQYKKDGWSIGVVPNKDNELSSAQVLHNNLHTGDKGREIIVIYGDTKIYIGLTNGVQNIDAYSARDYDRPHRDNQVGMLPPKLAQIIINLAVGSNTNSRIWDPFCGTGVLLQEALLMGHDVLGSDISPRMVDYSTKNLDWLSEKHTLPSWEVEKGDAREYTPSSPIHYVAAELFLGAPQSNSPSSSELQSLLHESKDLISEFLKNVHSYLPDDTRLCIAVPAWRVRNNFETAITVDDLSKLGYNPVRFTHVDETELIYARPDQTTGRKLLVLTKQQ